MVVPRGGGSPAPTGAATFILGNAPLGIGLTSELPALQGWSNPRHNLGNMTGENLSLSALSLVIGLLVLLSQLGRIDRDQPERCQGDAAILILDFDLALHTTSIPAPWRLT